MTLLAGQMMASLQTSIVSVAAPSIRHDLHVAGAAVQLIVSGYVLAYAVLLVTGARLGADHGPRRLFLLRLAGFTLFSVASALAPGVWVLVAAQVVLGASAALMVPQVLSLIHVTFQGVERERAVELYSARRSRHPARGQGLGGRTLDLPGVLTLAAAMVLLAIPLTFGPELGWPRWAWLCLAGGPLVTASFVTLEVAALRSRCPPLLDLQALLAPGVSAGLLVVLATMASYAGLLFTLSLYLQTGLGFTPLAAGLTFTPYPAGFAGVSLTWSRLAPGIQRWLPSAGLVALAAARVVLAARLPSGWSSSLLPLLLLGGAGHAAAFSPLVAQIAQRLSSERASAFSALVTTTTAIAVVISGWRHSGACTWLLRDQVVPPSPVTRSLSSARPWPRSLSSAWARPCGWQPASG